MGLGFLWITDKLRPGLAPPVTCKADLLADHMHCAKRKSKSNDNPLYPLLGASGIFESQKYDT